MFSMIVPARRNGNIASVVRKAATQSAAEAGKRRRKIMSDLLKYRLCARLAIPPAAKLIYFYLLDKSNGSNIAISV
jgi:hypothetical protein